MKEYRPYRGKQGKEILYYWTPKGEKPIYRTVRQLIESVDAAKEAMDYSNYDNANFDRIKEIILIWAKKEKIFLGFKPETLKNRLNKKYEKQTNAILKKLELIK